MQEKIIDRLFFQGIYLKIFGKFIKKLEIAYEGKYVKQVLLRVLILIVFFREDSGMIVIRFDLFLVDYDELGIGFQFELVIQNS